MGIRARLALLLCLALAAACVKSKTYRGPSRTSGTCEGACRHYMSCKRLENGEVFRSCVVECQEIFVEDGVADSASLRHFERLQCDDTIAFIEGKSGRIPGE